MSAMFGGAAKEARKAQEQQRVANDRQLAALNEQDKRAGISRRNPRGRRLFMSNAAEKTNLS